MESDSMNFIDRQTEDMPPGAAQTTPQPMVEKSIADALAVRVAELEFEIESMINTSAVRNHGASGLCCLMRARERDRANELATELAAAREEVDKWRELALENKWSCYGCGYFGECEYDGDEPKCPECGTMDGDGFGMAENDPAYKSET